MEKDPSFVPERQDGFKALLQSERTAINDSTLVQEEVFRTIIEGTEPFKCWREITPTVNAGSYRIRFVKGEAGTYAGEVAEGAKIDIDVQEYSAQNIDVVKYGVRPVITNELIDDALFDVVEHELKKAGARMENALNRLVLDKILNGANKITTSTHNPAGPHIAVSDLARAVGMVKKQNYIPDTLVTHPTAEAYLFQDSNIAYAAYMGTAGPLTSGKVPKLLGLSPYTCTATDKSSPTWDDTTAASDVTALVFSKMDLAKLLIRDDIHVNRYDDPIHDLVGMSVLMRIGADVVNEKAGCLVYHK
jgi:HK97 family phage major capsid protein